MEEENKEPSTMEEAKQILSELKEQNEVFKQRLLQAEKAEITNLLSGDTEAGQVPVKVDEGLAAARGLIAGSGFEDMVD